MGGQVRGSNAGRDAGPKALNLQVNGSVYAIEQAFPTDGVASVAQPSDAQTHPPLSRPSTKAG